ncbi:MAG TPA: sensor histidine kinase [Symbiobacteriaceae bacterium]|nr:sensor histidine kinase [Symbiobacteriaceae bacterium]
MRRYSFGLQWKLSFWVLLASIVAAAASVGLYWLARRIPGLTEGDALLAAVAGNLLLHVVSVYVVLQLARSLKLRLWEAGDMAGRLAHGDFGARLPAGEADEVGELYDRLNQMGEALASTVGRLKELGEQNRVLAEEALSGAALAERARLARDLHDGVNQLLFVQAMRAAALRKQLEKQVQAGSTGLERLIADATTLEEGAREAHTEARSLILQLRPTALEQQGLGPALAEYAQTAAQKAGWQLELQIDPAVRLFGDSAEALFRVAQEALNNVTKHAQAQGVLIELRLDGDAVRLAIRDDGVGFQASATRRPTAVGLVGMQERVAALGGQLQLRSRQGGGTEVSVRLPVQVKKEGTA